MPTITKKQLEDYNKLCEDRTYGRILTPDGLRMICEAIKYELFITPVTTYVLDDFYSED